MARDCEVAVEEGRSVGEYLGIWAEALPRLAGRASAVATLSRLRDSPSSSPHPSFFPIRHNVATTLCTYVTRGVSKAGRWSGLVTFAVPVVDTERHLRPRNTPRHESPTHHRIKLTVIIVRGLISHLRVKTVCSTNKSCTRPSTAFDLHLTQAILGAQNSDLEHCRNHSYCTGT